MLDLEIYKLKKNYKISEKELKQVLKRAGKMLRLKNLKISLAIVDDKTIRKLNKECRFRDKVTDVLSFELSPLIFIADDTDSQKRSIDVAAGFSLRGGEIVISYPEAKRQAREYKEPLQKTVLRLFVHGLLHIAGYEHKTKDDYNKMIKIQNKLCLN